MRNRVTRLVLAFSTFAAAQGGLPLLEGATGGATRLAWPAIPSAHAQSNAELTAARRLFSEALADQGAQRYGAALEKFQRVQAVRDTQAVRYRIATCFEAMGKLRAALESYTAASVAAGTDAESANVARASRDKLASLSKRVARVVVNLPPKAPDDAVVKIDGEVVQSNAIGTPVVVDPGPHEISALATGMQAFRAPTTIGEGGTATVDVILEPAPRAAPEVAPAPVPAAAIPSPPPPAAPPAPPRVAEVTTPAPDSPRASSHASFTAGVALVTGGSILIAGSIALLLVREADISSLESACPGGLCPVSRESDLESMRSRAETEGPVAIGVGAAGVVAVGVGIALLVTSGGSDHDGHAGGSGLTPWVGGADGRGRGLGWSARF